MAEASSVFAVLLKPSAARLMSLLLGAGLIRQLPNSNEESETNSNTVAVLDIGSQAMLWFYGVGIRFGGEGQKVYVHAHCQATPFPAYFREAEVCGKRCG